MNSESVSLKLKGNEFYRRKKYSEAIEMYKKGLDICNRDHHLFHSNISACYIVLLDYERGLYYAVKSVSLQPLFEKGRNRVILCLLKLRRFEEAEFHLKQLKSSSMKSKFESILDEELKVRKNPFRMFSSTPKSPHFPRIAQRNPMMGFGIGGQSSSFSVHNVEKMHLFVHEGDIYCLGDRTEETSLCRLFLMKPDYNSWIEKRTVGENPPVNLGRFEIRKVGNKIFVFGGTIDSFVNFEHSSEPSNEIYTLHLDSMRWEKINPVTKKPISRVNFGFHHYDNKLFILFGSVFSKERRPSTILVFDLEKKEWDEITNIEFFRSNSSDSNEVLLMPMRDNHEWKEKIERRLWCLMNDCLIRNGKLIIFEKCNEMTQPGEIELLKRFYTIEGLFQSDRSVVKVVERDCVDCLSIEDRIRRHREFGHKEIPKLKNSTVMTYNSYTDSLLLFDPYFATFLSFSYSSDTTQSCWIPSVEICNDEVMKMLRKSIPMDPEASVCKWEDFISGKGMIVKDEVVFIMGMMDSDLMTRVFMGEKDNPCCFGKKILEWRRTCFQSRMKKMFFDVVIIVQKK